MNMGKLFSKSSSSSRTRSRYSSQDATNNSAMAPRQFPAIHSDAVSSLAAVCPGMVLSGSHDRTTILFNYGTLSMEAKWTGHDKEVTKVAYGQATDTAFSASRDKTVKMWKKGHADPVMTYSGHEMVVTGLDVNDDNTQICTGSRDNSIRIWDVQNGTCVMENTISRNLITHVKWANSADMVAQTSEDKELRIWDPRTLTVSHNFPKKQYIQTYCDISPDNLYCLTCSNGFQGNGCEATLWDLRTCKLLNEYKGHIETTSACIFLPHTNNKPLIATSSSDCSVRIWNRDTKECVCSHAIGGSGPLTSLVAYNDNSLCVASFNTGIRVLQLGEDEHGNFGLNEKMCF